MNNKTLTFILIAALAASLYWGFSLKNEKHNMTALQNISICGDEVVPSFTKLDTMTAHDMIETYVAFSDSLKSLNFMLNKDSTTEVGVGKFRGPFDVIFEEVLSNKSFRSLYPCEYYTMLNDASTAEGVYVAMAVNNNPATGLPTLDLIYKIKTDKAVSEYVDSEGYYYTDDQCPCNDPCCCDFSPCPAQTCDCCPSMASCSHCPGPKKGCPSNK